MAQTQICRGRATAILHEDTGVRVKYHGTIVFRYDVATSTVTLNSGGWRTNTTKLRINQTISQFLPAYKDSLRVFQKAKVWYVEFRVHSTPFADGMVIKLQP